MNRYASTIRRFSPALIGLAVLSHAPVSRAQARARGRNARTSTPVAQSPSPVSLRIEPSGTSLHWSFTLENTSGARVETVADRRLLRIEIAPSASVATTPTPRSRARHRAPRAVTCRMPSRPATNEQANRVGLGPGERYTEGFDVRDICGVRLPAGFVPGATVQVHYGFENAHGFAHAITLDDQDPPVTDISTAAPIVVPGDASAWPPSSDEASRGDPRLRVTASAPADVADLAALRATVRIQSASHYPIWLFNRPGQVRFEVTNPRGETTSCRRGLRDYAPVRDFFTRMTSGRSITETLALQDLCNPEPFAIPGTYRAQAVFETRASGERFGLQSFTGASSSPYFFFRITRGAQPGPYQRLPVSDPFAPASSSTPSTERDATSNRP
jgi:hypothetical protein